MKLEYELHKYTKIITRMKNNRYIGFMECMKFGSSVILMLRTIFPYEMNLIQAYNTFETWVIFSKNGRMWTTLESFQNEDVVNDYTLNCPRKKINRAENYQIIIFRHIHSNSIVLYFSNQIHYQFSNVMYTLNILMHLNASINKSK